MSNTVLKVGDQAPDFTLPADGNHTVTLSDFRGKKVVLYFYPKDDTPGCSQEARNFRDMAEQFAAAGTIILGVSKDSPVKHDKFKQKYDLPFTLVSDENAVVTKNYGVWVQKSMFGKKYMGIERATYLLDEEGKIACMWRKVKVTGHIKEVLETAKKLG